MTIKKINLAGSNSRANRESIRNAGRQNFAEINRRIGDLMYQNACAAVRGDGPSWSTIEQEKDAVAHLAIALAILGDRSAVDALGISY
jgi:hypothetical protein